LEHTPIGQLDNGITKQVRAFQRLLTGVAGGAHFDQQRTA